MQYDPPPYRMGLKDGFLKVNLERSQRGLVRHPRPAKSKVWEMVSF